MYVLPNVSKLNFLLYYKMRKMSIFAPQANFNSQGRGKYGNYLKLKSIDFQAPAFWS